MTKRRKGARLKERQRKDASDAEEQGYKNWDVKCMNCDEKPTVGDLGLCGPCCFGEAETLGGNW